jgi:hypothetical protein
MVESRWWAVSQPVETVEKRQWRAALIGEGVCVMADLQA